MPDLSPKQWLLSALGAVLVVLVVWDVAVGTWVDHAGRVTNHTWYISYDSRCVARNSKGDCTSTVTEPHTHYFLTVQHEGQVDVVEVFFWDYARFSDGDACRIKYRQGGLTGIHWLITIHRPTNDWQ